jgi:NAD(P)H-dependent FMN reductase
MNSLLLLNGSPRGTSGNTPILLARLAEGWAEASAHTASPGPPSTETDEESVRTLHLARPSDFEAAVGAFGEAETVILGMPLYTDAMPGRVKEFIERLEQYVDREGNPRLGFLVQSGFTESLHSRHLERYLEKLARRLGCEYAGTIVKGGGEGIRLQPDSWNRKLFDRTRGLGASLALHGSFDDELLAEVAGTERFSATQRFSVRVLNATSLGHWHWNSQLKKNGAYEDRFARPYA